VHHPGHPHLDGHEHPGLPVLDLVRRAHLFGDQLDEFDHTVRATLAQFSDTDTFDEDNEFLIRIGRRARQ
jgi:hypothetical protein